MYLLNNTIRFMYAILPLKLKYQFIGVEIDKESYSKAKDRIIMAFT